MMHRRSMLVKSTLAVLGLSLLSGSAVGAQKARFSKSLLVGSWTLVSLTPSVSTVKSYGVNDGVVIFEPSGRFAHLLLASDLPRFASNNRDAGTPDENKAIVHGSLGLFGTYSFNNADGTLTLHVVRSSFPNWNGTDQTRIITSLTTTEMKWHNPAASVGGTIETVWKRAK